MKLNKLLERVPDVRVFGDIETDIIDLCTDSRKAKQGSLFFCIPGLHSDAHDFAPQAVKAGAVALIVERQLEIDVPQVLVKNVRLALSYIAAAFYGYPADRLKIIGITGTKGKTTTSYMLKHILEAAGCKVGLIGTVCILIGDREIETEKTTPDPQEFQEILSEMEASNVDYVVMEVSAHALDMHRLAGIRFVTAGFTNLSQDHLDYFGDMQTYLAAKLLIGGMTDELCVNADDETVCDALEKTGVNYTRVGIREKALVYARNIDIIEGGIEFELYLHRRTNCKVNMSMTGIFNVYNALMAAALADKAGISIDDIRKGLESVKSVPGRVELLDTHTPYNVILDYAHSPNALENILETLRQNTKKRLISVFGCGGGRDKLKRPIMGEIGTRLSDIAVITSDNPRNEEPMTIINEIVAGIKDTNAVYTVIENRREAIRYALKTAEAGDVVVLAGKGHETYQEINGVKHPFDEKIIVSELLEELYGID